MHCIKTTMICTRIRFLNLCVLAFLLAPVAASSQSLFKKETRYFAPGDSATFMLTNKFSSFFYGEIGQFASRRFQGFNIKTEEFLEDYILLRNGQTMLRSQASVEVRADKLIRIYPDSTVTEEVVLLDTANVLQISLRVSEPCEISFLPALGGSNKASDFTFDIAKGLDRFSGTLKQRLETDAKNDLQQWVSVSSRPEGVIEQISSETQQTFSKRFKYPAAVPVQLKISVSDSAVIRIEIGDKNAQIMANSGEQK